MCEPEDDGQQAERDADGAGHVQLGAVVGHVDEERPTPAGPCSLRPRREHCGSDQQLHPPSLGSHMGRCRSCPPPVRRTARRRRYLWGIIGLGGGGHAGLGRPVRALGLRLELDPGLWRWAGDGLVLPFHLPKGKTRADLIESALVEWRTWLETLAARFDGLGLPAGPPSERLAAWERAVTVLVTDVVTQTQTTEAWYVHCEQVLAWFLTHQGVPRDRRASLLGKAIGGRFSSWTEPGPELVTDLGRRIAAAAQQATRHA